MPSKHTAIGVFIGLAGLAISLILSVNNRYVDPHKLATEIARSSPFVEDQNKRNELIKKVEGVYTSIKNASTNVFRERAVKALQEHDARKAANFLEQSARLHLGQSELHSHQAFEDWINAAKLFESHDPKKALHAYQQALEIDEEHAEAWNSSGLIHLHFHNIPEAKKAFSTALSFASNDPMITAATIGNLGIVHTYEGDFDKAEKNLHEAIEIDQSNKQTWGISNHYCNLGNLYMQQGDLRNAEDAYRNSLSIREKFGDAYGMSTNLNQLGNVFQATGDQEKSKEYYLDAIGLQLECGFIGPGVLFNLAMSYLKNGELDLAESAVWASLKVRDNDTTAPFRTKHLHKYAAIRSLIDILRERIKLHASTVDSSKLAEWYWEIILHYSMLEDTRPGDAQNVKEYSQKALELLKDRHPDNASKLFQNGYLYLKAGDLDSSEKAFKKLENSIKTETDSALLSDAYGQIADYYMKTEDLTKAAEITEKSLAINKSLGKKEASADDYLQLGIILNLDGKHYQAEAMIEKSIEVNRTFAREDKLADCYLILGNVHLELKNLTEAEEYYEKSIKTNRALRRQNGLADGFIGIGSVNFVKDKLDEADNMYRKSLEIYDDQGDNHGKAIAIANLGMTNEERGDCIRAIAMYQNSARIFKESGDQAYADKAADLSTDCGKDREN